MKNKTGLLLLISFLIIACFSCTTKSAKFDSLHRNETALPDSVYFGYALQLLDTMPGFKAYFDDTSNINWINDTFNILEKVNTSEEKITDVIFFEMMVKNYVFNTVKNAIYMSKRSKPSLVGCRYGNLNKTIISLRKNNEFDIHLTSFFRDDINAGTYKIKSDTLLLTFTTEKKEHLGDTLLISDEAIIAINKKKGNYLNFEVLKLKKPVD